MTKARRSLETEFTCPLSSGLHARPASQMAEIANGFVAEAVLTNLRTGANANAKSVLAIIAADVRHGDRCSLHVSGTDAEAAFHALERFADQVLPKCDALEPLAASHPSVPVPRALRSSAIDLLPGSCVSDGIAEGEIAMISGLALPKAVAAQAASDPAVEREEIEGAIAGVIARIRQKLGETIAETEAAVLKADLAIARDISLAEKLFGLVDQGRSAAQAVVEAGHYFVSLLRHSESDYIRERALDMQEICVQLLEELHGPGDPHDNGDAPRAITLERPSVVVAETLAPQQLLSLDRRWLRALVLEYAGATSHAVILARSLGIPTLVGVKNARALRPGRKAIVDADRGYVVSEITPAIRRFYDQEIGTLARRHEALAQTSLVPAITGDGVTLEVAANVSSGEEAETAFRSGADGIGLFRTEMLFLGAGRAPSEEEQFSAYAAAVRAAAGKPVIIRTLDIGGDKPLRDLRLPTEANPFLGYRGARIYPEHREILQAQLRAILRASALGPVQVMAPMISSLEEVIAFKDEIAGVQRDLKSRGIIFDARMPMGIMIEVPAVAFVLDKLCAEVDFFSIGTNDLSQYFHAADRNNPRVARLCSARQPGFLRFLKHIVDEIHASGKWVGMCGDMAADELHLPLLIGLQLDEISMPAAMIPRVKNRIARLSAAGCRDLLAEARVSERVAEVDELLRDHLPLGPPLPLLDRSLVLLDSNSENKEEAIREIVDAFYVTGRTEKRQELEDALWARESVYSTGLGFGFATPHCKTDAVMADSIGVLRLKAPCDWGSVDGEPVRMVVLLAIRSSEANTLHMQVFSQLARKLMNEEFREHLLSINDSESAVEYLSQQLGLTASESRPLAESKK